MTTLDLDVGLRLTVESVKYLKLRKISRQVVRSWNPLLDPEQLLGR